MTNPYGFGNKKIRFCCILSGTRFCGIVIVSEIWNDVAMKLLLSRIAEERKFLFVLK